MQLVKNLQPTLLTWSKVCVALVVQHCYGLTNILTHMNYIKVKSVEHLKELLNNNESEFVVAFGICRSSKYITADEDGIFMLHYADDSEECLTWEQVEAEDSYLLEKINNGTLYCETNKYYEP